MKKIKHSTNFQKFLVNKQNSPVKKIPLFDVTPLLAEDEVSKDLDYLTVLGKGLKMKFL